MRSKGRKVQLIDMDVSDNDSFRTTNDRAASREVDMTIDYKYTSPEYSGRDKREDGRREESNRMRTGRTGIAVDLRSDIYSQGFPSSSFPFPPPPPPPPLLALRRSHNNPTQVFYCLS
jgi:hypothetical protein